MTTNEPTGPIISYHADLPGFIVNGVKIGRHWHVQATRDGDLPITCVGRTYDEALAAVKRNYNELDGWPIGPSRLDPHRGTPAAWRWPVKPRGPQAACKLAGQPAPFVFDPMQDLDRALARARKVRRETFDAAGRWLADRWLGLLVFVALAGTLFAFHGHWSTSVWMETLQ